MAVAAEEREKDFEDLHSILDQVSVVLGKDVAVNQASFDKRKTGGWRCTVKLAEGRTITAKTDSETELTPVMCASMLQKQSRNSWNILVNGQEDRALGDEVGSLLGVTVSSCVTGQG